MLFPAFTSLFHAILHLVQEETRVNLRRRTVGCQRSKRALFLITKAQKNCKTTTDKNVASLTKTTNKGGVDKIVNKNDMGNYIVFGYYFGPAFFIRRTIF